MNINNNLYNKDFCLDLLDIHLSSMNGTEFAKLIRRISKTKNVPIFLETTTNDNKTSKNKQDSHALKNKVNVLKDFNRQKAGLRNQVQTLKKIRNEQAKFLIELNKTKEQLEQSIQRREEFMSIAGHELKTPLTILKLRMQLRKRKLQTGQYSNMDNEILSQMIDSDSRQLEILALHVNDMLDISRISSGKFSMNFEYFNICHLIKDISERSSELSNIKVFVTTCESIFGRWDKFRIEQVITNILTNAIRYGAGKPVQVKIGLENENVIIIIEDQGIGISSENLSKIFLKFEQITGAETEGLGLGLYIVNQIIEAHGGIIKVESQQGEGSAFKIILPLNN